ncbi:iron complex transport system ATP-binding protein [Agromyces flavus]|uniref:Iron complex transport system ATP-binding protein n=1 Tax=Agromyces flavus TaxID=589382 RepID=A0A1H1U475_9MICO|nr:ABC transporter ATP-binding protein [Agromyces flavus]MCP2368296.1 iron complex transport system ATP-binding protein [Agromyces flavus]GGI47757.1 iron-dicitrate ABC transporter ATP-binding protein [Agromyces flavus]SDS67153.1 iron complex transport system ATP-binding protein [Agromyces flavus]
MSSPNVPAPRGVVRLAAQGVSLGYDGRRVIDGLDLVIPPGRITAIVGPNACGKSTLLRGLARLHPLEAGRVTLDGQDVGRMPRRDVARRIGVLPQSSSAPDGVRVADLVGRGRYPHQGWFGRHSSDDDEVVAEALAATGVADLADRPIEELSGGQRQRVWIAMVLAQQTDLVLLDEPTTFLDVTHQLELLDLLTHLNRERGTTVVMVLHELNLAARYADHLVVMSAGRIVAEGGPDDVLTTETVRGAFGLEARVIPDPVSGGPMVVPIGRFHAA